MSDMTVATTILEQLGGRKFLAMTGARHLLGDANSLQFKLPKGLSPGINLVKVTLTPADDYIVDFGFFGKNGYKPKARHEGIYCDQLRSLFERETGLATSLGGRVVFPRLSAAS